MREPDSVHRIRVTCGYSNLMQCCSARFVNYNEHNIVIVDFKDKSLSNRHKMIVESLEHEASRFLSQCAAASDKTLSVWPERISEKIEDKIPENSWQSSVSVLYSRISLVLAPTARKLSSLPKKQQE